MCRCNVQMCSKAMRAVVVTRVLDMCVCVCVRARVCVCVCVCVREREREREREERERESRCQHIRIHTCTHVETHGYICTHTRHAYTSTVLAILKTRNPNKILMV
jgi:hypothetical protein